MNVLEELDPKNYKLKETTENRTKKINEITRIESELEKVNHANVPNEKKMLLKSKITKEKQEKM